MQDDASNSSLLTQGPIIKALSSIMLPMAIMMFTSIGFSYLDAWFVSRLGHDALSAIDICFPLVNLCSAILYGGLGTGVSAAVARRHGKDDQNGALLSLKMGFLLAIPLALFFTLFVILGKDYILSVADTPAIKELAYEYCFWYFLPIVIMAFGAVASSAMRGVGNAKKPAIYGLICMVLNGILTPLFCFEIGLGMGMKGAAISTVICYSLMTILLVKDLVKGVKGFAKFNFSWQMDKEILRAIFFASSIAALLPMMTNIVIYIMLKIMSHSSLELMDAFSLAKRFELYAIQLTVCLGASTMVVIGASHDNLQRVRDVLKTSMKFLFGIGIPITLLMMIDSDFYYTTLTSKKDILLEGQKYFLFGGLNMLFTCGIILMNFSFQGLGKPAAPIPFSLTSVVLVQGFAGAYIVSSGMKVEWFYSVVSLATMITFFLIFRRFRKYTQC